MANSHRTIKARKQRKLAKAWVKAFNGDSSEMNKLNNEQRKLQVNGSRYGNKRKYMADTKVLERRAERKRLNSQKLED